VESSPPAHVFVVAALRRIAQPRVPQFSSVTILLPRLAHPGCRLTSARHRVRSHPQFKGSALDKCHEIPPGEDGILALHPFLHVLNTDAEDHQPARKPGASIRPGRIVASQDRKRLTPRTALYTTLVARRFRFGHKKEAVGVCRGCGEPYGFSIRAC
jgi:hypothetical protein